MRRTLPGKRPFVPTRKQRLKLSAAKLLRNSLFVRVLGLAVRLTVPRQRVGVALVALNEADEVFMLRHVFHPYYEWGLPGGWLKKNEAPEVGVLRELKEETGLTAVLGSAVSVSHSLQPPHIGIAYGGRLAGGDLQLSHEIIEASWFSVDNLPTPLSPHTHQAIRAAVHASERGILLHRGEQFAT